LCDHVEAAVVTADSSTPDDPDGASAAAGDGSAAAPDRPPSLRFVDALGVRAHVRRGVAVGVVLAVGVFGFFVVWPAVDPTRPARQESPVLYAALAFVVATSATLLVASALAVRSVVARVMAYEKWVARASVGGALGGAWWAVTGALATAGAAGVAPTGVADVVRATLPLPVLLLAFGTWSALARTGIRPATARPAAAAVTKEFDHVQARPRVATVGAVFALGGVVLLHAAAFLDTPTLVGTAPPALVGAFTLGAVALAVGTAALASALRQRTSGVVLPAAAGVLAGVGAGLGVGSALTGLAVLAPIGGACCLGVAWVALGVAVSRDPGTYPERPL
jgi:hypothetical protein